MKKYIPYFLASSCLIFIGMTLGFATKHDILHWYPLLHKPTYNPPDWIFKYVWTLLYGLLGISLIQIYRHKTQYPLAWYSFATNLVLNFSWSPIFFICHKIDYALAIIGLMIISLVVCMYTGRKIRYVIPLLLPYLSWISFAFLLNWQLYQLN